MIEEWRPVVGAEERYEVSNTGWVRSIPRKLHFTDRRGRAFERVVKGKVLAISHDSFGYRSVSLFPYKGKSDRPKIYALMMEAFVGPRPYKHDICHINGDKVDDRLENLRYGTRKQNTEDARLHGTLTVGSKNSEAILNEEVVLEMREEYAAGGITLKALGVKHGVAMTTVQAVIQKRNWAHVGGPDWVRKNFPKGDTV